VGIFLYGESSSVIRLGSASMIVIGIIGLKVANG
jgi:multidrug transporter EmrE-like cation transporter